MIFTAPDNISFRDRKKKSVFLGGTIEMGENHDWQKDFIDKLSYGAIGFNVDTKSVPFNVFNPRRANWDNSWTQDFNNPNFFQQVEWELGAMDKADYIVMYFDPVTKSPISLLELGLHAISNKLLVCCPAGYWKKGNVDVVCSGYNIAQFNSLDDIASFLKSKV